MGGHDVGGTQTDLSCANAFVDLPRTPRGPDLTHDVFDDLAAQIRAAHSEVLVANMQWDFGLGLPGSTVVAGVADLYAQVKADPAAYPQGMAVRFSLGGYPDLVRTVDGATQALSLARDLRLRGVPLDDPTLGWRVSILNYPYFPHSHVKLHVIDGQDLTVGSYNMSWTQLPRAEGGNSQHDTGLHLRGPVAQAGVAAFDDLWRHSQQLHCPPGSCRWRCLTAAPWARPSRRATRSPRSWHFRRGKRGPTCSTAAPATTRGTGRTSP
ncbi:hypothetical protein ACXXDK_06070 [Deinococcus sp. PESE-38]